MALLLNELNCRKLFKSFVVLRDETGRPCKEKVSPFMAMINKPTAFVMSMTPLIL